MKPFQLIGQGIDSGYQSITCQQRVNCYVETRTDGENSTTAIYGTPCLDLFTTVGATPIRGIFGIGYNFGVVSEGNIYAVNNAGQATLAGYLTTSEGRVTIINNGSQTLVLDGTTSARLIDTSAGTSEYVAAEGFPACTHGCFLDGYFIVMEDDTQKFFISGLYDGTTWNALDFASAESNPDNLVSIFADHGQLMLFGEFSTEIWGNNGAQDFPYQRIATPTEWGLAAPWSIAKLDNTVAFLGRNRLGQVQVVMMTGYTAQRISTDDVDRIINSTDSYATATAYSYMINGHSMYVLNVAGKTLMFDLNSSLWSTLTTGTLSRNRAEMSANFLQRTMVADYENGKVYELTDNVYDDNGDASVLTIVSRHMTTDARLLVLRELEIAMEHGVGLSTGQGIVPKMMVSISKDGGHTFGAERLLDIGEIGDYVTRTRINRLGQCRDFAFKLSISDPIRRAIIGAYLTVE